MINAIRKQLEAKERARKRELANQSWVIEQFMKSPSWRLTAPLRWLAKQFRAFGIVGRRKNPEPGFSSVPQSPQEEGSPFDLKGYFTGLYLIQLRSFLAANTPMRLPHSENPEISVILVLFNRAELTFACLRSLAENYSERLEIIIVDNASSDDTSLLLDRLQGPRIIRNAENQNFVLGVNQAAREARGEYLLLLNNDAQVLPGTLPSTLRTIRSSPDIGAVGGRLVFLDGSLQEAASIVWRDGTCLGYGRGDDPFAPMYMFRRDVDYCSAAFLLTPRRVWEKIGGFDERFKPAYYEDTDYCTCVRELGLRIVYDPNSVLLHYEFASSSSKSRAIDLQRKHHPIFLAKHEKFLANHYWPDPNSILPARMQDGGKTRVLFIDDRVPHAWLGSGFPRARAILLTLLQEGSFVTHYSSDPIDEDWSSIYSDMPPEVEFMTGYDSSLLEPFLRGRPSYYNTIFVSRPHNMKILKPILDAHPEWFAQTNIIYDAEAIFVSREITLRQLTGAPLPAEEAEALLQEEVACASAAGCVLAVSEMDAGEFRKHGIESVHVVGHSISPAPTPRAFSEREGFLFVGPIYDATPNEDSVLWFIEEVLPRIRAALGENISFTIAGANESQRVKELARPPIRITGHLRDLTELYDTARVFVAPTRYAAGIPHKVHEAAARGVPIVATPLLALQLGWRDDDPVLTGAGAELFAAKCIALYTDELLWSNLREAALKRIQKECSKQSFEANLKNVLTRSLINVGMDR